MLLISITKVFAVVICILMESINARSWCCQMLYCSLQGYIYDLVLFGFISFSYNGPNSFRSQMLQLTRDD